MAKWGEGDPRWIVEERPDATNVNNWHWSEKNANQWSKEKFRQLFEGLTYEEPGLGFVRITSLKSMEGEAVANNRKGKVILFYEWVIKGSWVGALGPAVADSKKCPVKGEFEIPNLSEENGRNDIEVTVSLDDTSRDDDGCDALKELMRLKMLDSIRAACDSYVKLMREEFAKDLIKPTKGDGLPHSASLSSNLSAAAAAQQASKKSSDQNTISKSMESDLVLNGTGHVKINTATIDIRVEMKCTAQELYRAFTNRQMVDCWTRGQVTDFDPINGGSFKLFDGNVVGKFSKLTTDKEITMLWRFKTWPAEHYSDVTLKFEEKSDCTDLVLHQTGVPKSHEDNTRKGWHNYYFEAMKRSFGFGVPLY